MARGRSLLLGWLSCLLLVVVLMVVSSAPVDEGQQKEEEMGLVKGLDAVNRSKRASLRKKSSKPLRSLVRYRYPVAKRSGGGLMDGEEDTDDDEQEQQQEEAVLALLAEKLGAGDNDNNNAFDLTELAKEIALDILMEEMNQRNQQSHSQAADEDNLMKKKKKKSAKRMPAAKRMDDKRRKRMKSIVEELMEEEEAEDDEDEHSAPMVNDDDDDEMPEIDREDNDARTVLRALAEQGLGPQEIEALLDRAGPDSGSYKKRSVEWKKLPRSTLRWRFLHSQGDDTESMDRHEHPSNANEDELEQPEQSPARKFFGRGFHRVGSAGNQPEEVVRGVLQAEAAKRIQHPLKAKNAVSVIKRSADEHREKESSSSDTNSIVRKRRSASPLVEPINKPNDTLFEPIYDNEDNQTDAAASVQKQEDDVLDEDSAPHSSNIRKKSVDWDDYFGFDKRSSRGPSGATDESGSDDAVRDYLESEYYKAIAGSLAYRRKRTPQQHAGHIMKKRENQTYWGDKRSAAQHSELADAEEALDAAFRAAEERREQQASLEELRSELASDLVDNLNDEDLEEMTNQLAKELSRAIREDEEAEEDDEDEALAVKRSAKKRYHKRSPAHKKKKKNVNDDSDDDQRRKRYSPKHAQRRSDDDCQIAGEVVATCNMVSSLYGGYRPLLSDACFRHQACSICMENESACDADFQQHVLSVCGPDLLCQSQSRHLLSALGQLDQMESEYLQSNQHQIQALCRADECLAAYWKRR